MLVGSSRAHRRALSRRCSFGSNRVTFIASGRTTTRAFCRWPACPPSLSQRTSKEKEKKKKKRKKKKKGQQNGDINHESSCRQENGRGWMNVCSLTCFGFLYSFIVFILFLIIIFSYELAQIRTAAEPQQFTIPGYWAEDQDTKL